MSAVDPRWRARSGSARRPLQIGSYAHRRCPTSMASPRRGATLQQSPVFTVYEQFVLNSQFSLRIARRIASFRGPTSSDSCRDGHEIALHHGCAWEDGVGHATHFGALPRPARLTEIYESHKIMHLIVSECPCLFTINSRNPFSTPQAAVVPNHSLDCTKINCECIHSTMVCAPKLAQLKPEGNGRLSLENDSHSGGARCPSWGHDK